MRDYDNRKEEKKGIGRTYLSEPLTFWIGFLVVALLIEILLSTTSLISQGTSGFLILSTIYNFLLSGPGLLILPAIAGVLIGREIGIHSKDLGKALKLSLLDGIYGSIIYSIAICIIYGITVYSIPNSNVNPNMLITSWIALPVAVFMILAIFLSGILHSRKTVSKPDSDDSDEEE